MTLSKWALLRLLEGLFFSSMIFISSLTLFLSQRVPGFTDAAADLDNGAANVMKVEPCGTVGWCAVTAAHGLPVMDNCVSLLLRQCGLGQVPRMPGRKYGMRQRLKSLTGKQTRASLASIILTNVCCLRNKLDEVQANM